jgi:hypothetical protein
MCIPGFASFAGGKLVRLGFIVLRTVLLSAGHGPFDDTIAIFEVLVQVLAWHFSDRPRGEGIADAVSDTRQARHRLRSDAVGATMDVAEERGRTTVLRVNRHFFVMVYTREVRLGCYAPLT